VIRSDESCIIQCVCPGCGARIDVEIAFTTVLKRSAQKSEIRVTLQQEAATHLCAGAVETAKTAPDPLGTRSLFVTHDPGETA